MLIVTTSLSVYFESAILQLLALKLQPDSWTMFRELANFKTEQ